VASTIETEHQGEESALVIHIETVDLSLRGVSALPKSA
jgi:hypothetical protein